MSIGFLEANYTWEKENKFAISYGKMYELEEGENAVEEFISSYYSILTSVAITHSSFSSDMTMTDLYLVSTQADTDADAHADAHADSEYSESE